MEMIKVPASKSIMIRILLIASMLKSKLRLRNVSEAVDIITLKTALQSLGFCFLNNNNETTVIPPSDLSSGAFCRILDSATGFRFLLARLTAAGKGDFFLDASKQLQKRPMQPLVKALQKLGAKINSSSFPYKISAGKLTGGKLDLDTSLSSQFLSAVLLVAPLCSQDVMISISGSRVSWNYARMTMKLLRCFSIRVIEKPNMIIVPAPQEFSSLSEIEIEPDYSSACYFWAIGASSGKSAAIAGERLLSYQADAAFPEILKKMGAHVEDRTDMTFVKQNKLHGIEIDMSQMPDQVLTLAVLALLSDSSTIISGIDHLQYKESDRIQTLIAELKRLQADCRYENGCLHIEPLSSPPPHIVIDSHFDHRLAMAFSILKVRFPYLKISNPAVVNKSFPGFWEQYNSLIM